MKLSELKKSAAPVSPRAANCEPDAVASAPQEPQGTSCVTPSGIEIAYEWAPRRLYKLRHEDHYMPADVENAEKAWQEVPSVTTVLGVLHKPALTWWGMKVGIQGVAELLHRDVLTSATICDYTAEMMVDLLTEQKLTVNHQLEKAADRGVNVHGILEDWVRDREIPHGSDWDDRPEGPYAHGLIAFLLAIHKAAADVEAELMVGSLEHQYAGRFDLVLTLSKPVQVVTRVYPKKPPRIEEIPAGRVLIDMKTSKRVYPATHFMQLEAYEAAAVECGYEPTDYRAILHVTADGRYELVINQDWTIDDFLAVRRVYSVLNEREVLRILREDLDAQEVK